MGRFIGVFLLIFACISPARSQDDGAIQSLAHKCVTLTDVVLQLQDLANLAELEKGDAARDGFIKEHNVPKYPGLAELAWDRGSDLNLAKEILTFCLTEDDAHAASWFKQRPKSTGPCADEVITLFDEMSMASEITSTSKVLRKDYPAVRRAAEATPLSDSMLLIAFDGRENRDPEAIKVFMTCSRP